MAFAHYLVTTQSKKVYARILHNIDVVKTQDVQKVYMQVIFLLHLCYGDNITSAITLPRITNRGKIQTFIFYRSDRMFRNSTCRLSLLQKANMSKSYPYQKQRGKVIALVIQSRQKATHTLPLSSQVQNVEICMSTCSLFPFTTFSDSETGKRSRVSDSKRRIPHNQFKFSTVSNFNKKFTMLRLRYLVLVQKF